MMLYTVVAKLVRRHGADAARNYLRKHHVESLVLPKLKHNKPWPNTGRYSKES